VVHHDGDVRVAEESVATTGHDVQHVGAAGRAEVLLPGFQIASGIMLKIRVISAQSILANPIRPRMEIRNHDSGVVAALAPYHLAARQGIDAAEANLNCQAAVNPASFQFRIVRQGEVGSETWQAAWTVRDGVGSTETGSSRAHAFSAFLCQDGRCILPLRKLTFHPLESMARAPTRAIAFWG
jgi:hypothetical protein